MAQAAFNAEATNRDELMSSRTPWFIQIEIKAAKGERLSREERQLMDAGEDLLGDSAPNPACRITGIGLRERASERVEGPGDVDVPPGPSVT